MAKLPKLSDFADVSGLMNKMKSALDNITGPGGSVVTAEALAQEKDPIKAKLLEVELLISQLHEMMVIQNKTINELESKYAIVKKLATDALVSKEEIKPSVESPVETTTSAVKEDASEVKEPPKD